MGCGCSGAAYRAFLDSSLFENKLDDVLVLGCAELGLECLVACLVVDALHTLPVYASASMLTQTMIVSPCLHAPFRVYTVVEIGGVENRGWRGKQARLTCA